ncbi:hypothetical protein JL722_9754 [Aureococcus anophagefferens]|nr:hypothetical protein JL722_9754 [Aureococcus anophagefferens]
MAPKKKKGGKKRRKIDEKVAEKLQSKLKAACIDTAPAKFFKKFDKDKSGDMNAKELSKMIRVSLKISEKELSEADVKALIDALDDDGSGSLSLDELADFVEHGTATFYADHAATEAADAGKRTTKWGAKDEPDEMKKLRRATAAKERKKKTLDEAEMAHFQMKLQAATFGHSPQELFKSFDKSGDGLLNAEELTHLIRVELRIRADPEHAHKHHKWGERAEECEAAKEDRKARLAKKARPDFDPDEMKKLQGRLQAATYGDDPLHIFRKFDATGDGVLDVPELTKMIRLELKISGSELPDDLIVAFVRAIDDDGSMTLSIDLCANQIFNPTSISLVDLHTGIDELADFVQYGMDTFYADHEETEAKSQAGGHKKGLGWGERAANPACMTVDPGPGDDEASHVSGLSHEGSSLATADNPHALEKTAARIHDDDGGPAGAPAAALSADDLEREIRETEERLRRLKAAKAARARVTTKQIYRPNPKPDSPHALFVDELLDDPLLRLDDCGLEPALRAFRASIVAEAPNNVATATALLKLGNLLRDVAEGREYTLNKATDAHRRALSLVATALSKEHSATLAIRFALADTLLLLKDSKGARAQYQAVLAVQSKQFPPPKTIGRTKERLAKLAEAGLYTLTAITMSDAIATAPLAETSNAPAPGPETVVVKKVKASTTESSPTKTRRRPRRSPWTRRPPAEAPKPEEPKAEAPKPEEAKPEEPEAAPAAPEKAAEEPVVEKAAEPEAVKEVVTEAVKEVAEPAAAEPAAEKAAEPVEPEEPKVAEPAAAAAEPAKEEPAKEEPAKAESSREAPRACVRWVELDPHATLGAVRVAFAGRKLHALAEELLTRPDGDAYASVERAPGGWTLWSAPLPLPRPGRRVLFAAACSRDLVITALRVEDEDVRPPSPIPAPRSRPVPLGAGVADDAPADDLRQRLLDDDPRDRESSADSGSPRLRFRDPHEAAPWRLSESRAAAGVGPGDLRRLQRADALLHSYVMLARLRHEDDYNRVNVTGVFGMNFDYLPIEHLPWAFASFCIGSFALVLVAMVLPDDDMPDDNKPHVV